MTANLSPLAYNTTEPRFHLIFGGGIDVMEQAMQQEGGNEINIYDIRTGRKLCEIGGAIGRINDMALFSDGSGVITANAEGKAIIFRFDKYYYENKDWK